MIDCLRSFRLVKGRHPPGCPRSSFSDVVVRGCQQHFEDGAHNRLHWRDRTCLARTEPITIWKASLLLTFLLLCQQDVWTTGADVLFTHQAMFLWFVYLSLAGGLPW